MRIITGIHMAVSEVDGVGDKIKREGGEVSREGETVTKRERELMREGSS